MSGKRDGEWASIPSGRPRTAAISPMTLGPGSRPPRPGFAPWPILISMASALAMASSVQPKYPDAISKM